jgi:hypothetical protein
MTQQKRMYELATKDFNVKASSVPDAHREYQDEESTTPQRAIVQ